MADQSIFSDDFNRPDEIIYDSVNWVQRNTSQTPNIFVESGTVVTNGEGSDAAIVSGFTYTDDQYAEIDVTSASGNVEFGLTLRQNPGVNSYNYHAKLIQGTTVSQRKLEITVFSANGFSSLATSTLEFSVNATPVRLRFQAIGAELKAFVDQTEYVSVANTDLSGGVPGISGFVTANDAFDNFDSGNITSASTPTITDIDTDESVYPSQSFVITGTNFGATQGAGAVDIDGVAQTVTSWSDTSITCTAVRGGNEYGTGKTLTVTTDAATTATLTVAQEAEPGTFAVTAASPNTTDPASLWSGLVDTATGDPVTVVDGDQSWVKTLLDGLAISPDGTITANETGTFTVQFWRASEGVWGGDQTVNFTLPSEPGTPSFVRGLKKALTSTLKKSLRTDI